MVKVNKTTASKLASNKRYTDKYRRKKRQYVYNYLAIHPCVDCGETDPIVLDFDHVRGIKVNNISTLAKCGSFDRLCEEILKCDIRCANCHRRKTAKEGGWSRLPD